MDPRLLLQILQNLKFRRPGVRAPRGVIAAASSCSQLCPCLRLFSWVSLVYFLCVSLIAPFFVQLMLLLGVACFSCWCLMLFAFFLASLLLLRLCQQHLFWTVCVCVCSCTLLVTCVFSLVCFLLCVCVRERERERETCATGGWQQPKRRRCQTTDISRDAMTQAAGAQMP